MAKAPAASLTVGGAVGVVLAISGLNPTINAVRRLPASIRGKIARPALRAGAKVILEETRRQVPVYRRSRQRKGRRFNVFRGRRPSVLWNRRPRRSPLPQPGLLKRSLRVRAMKSKRGRIGYNTQTSDAKNLFTGRAYYGAFLELGTRRGNRRTHPGIRKNKVLSLARQQRINPVRYMDRAYRKSKNVAYARVLEEMRRLFPVAVADAKAAKAAKAAGATH